MKDRRVIRGKGRRLRAACLAAVCLLSAAVSLGKGKLVGQAATFRGTNIWSGGSETLFGKSRNYLYRWTDGYQMTFCLSPGKHMGSTVVAGAVRTTAEDESIPYIGSRDDYEKLASICTWFDYEGSTGADNATYAAAQTAVWAIMNGGWETADALAGTVERHVPGTAKRFLDLKTYLEDAGGGMEGFPDWARSTRQGAREHPVPMNLAEGVWTAELDISQAPFMASLDWQFEGDPAGWSRHVSDGKLIITYTGSPGEGTLAWAALPAQYMTLTRNTESLNIYVPQSAQNRTQGMISAGPYVPKVFLRLSMSAMPDIPETGVPEVKRYEHRETFLAHYSVDLEKVCAETGKPLESAAFRVLEAFDGSQTDEEDDGGAVLPARMTPKPAVWENFKVCEELSTDPDGRVSHTDVKRYEYRKTYCDGHPEPEFLEPELDSGAEGYAAEMEAVARENERLKAEWEALNEECRLRTDFHSIDPGEGLQRMLEDREETYRRFIGLRYDYTFQETRARYGYVRHGQHSDDEPVPVIRVSSSEAGAGWEELENEEVIVDESIGSGSSFFGEGDAEDEERRGAEDAGAQGEEGEGRGGAGDEERRGAKDEGRRNGEDAENERNEEKRTPGNSCFFAEDIRRPAAGRPTPSAAGRGTAAGTATPSDAGKRPAAGMATSSDAHRPGREEFLDSYFMESRAASAGGAERDAAADVFLPEPEPDRVGPIEPAGEPDRVAFTFHVKDHRTEGEIHINKRDSQLLEGEGGDYSSYGDTQGDATLEGAVYGLYAADDIVHPDGKTGTVYGKGDLTAIGTTDKNGDASFMAYTEDSPVLSMTGHPLLPGRYLVREIGRSEGYEQTAWAEDPEGAGEGAAIGRADVAGALTHPVDMHDGSWLEFDVVSRDTAEGYEIYVSGFPEGSRFYRSEMKETAQTPEGGVIVGTRLVETGEYERAEPGEYRLDGSGNYIPERDADGNPMYDTSKPASRTYPLTRRPDSYPGGESIPQVDADKWQDETAVDPDYVADEANGMLEQLGYDLLDRDTGDDAPWTVIELAGDTNRELVLEILDWFALHSFWDSGAVHGIFREDGAFRAVVFHDQTGRPGDAVYEQATKTLYVRLPVTVEGKGRRHMYAVYPSSRFSIRGGYVTVKEALQAKGTVVFPEPMEDVLEPVYEPLYERYEEGEYRLDGNGDRIPVYRKEYIYEKKEEITSDYQLEPLAAEYDARTGTYRIHVENRTDWSRTDGPVTETFRAAAPYQTRETDGETLFYSDYLTDRAGAGASAFASVREPFRREVVELTYPGQISPAQDGTGTPGRGTRTQPFPAEERVIRQAVKVIKDTQGDETGKMSNFRFKVYLKSNLERLYRDREGKVCWLDRRGREIDILSANRSYPGPVPPIFTRVPRDTERLSKDRSEGVEANRALYDESLEEMPLEYTAVLEEQNYEKFFQAIRTANVDRWDEASPTYTSHRPLGNGANRSREAEENAKVSDMVRQFAIDWYLDGEAEKLTGAAGEGGDASGADTAEEAGDASGADTAEEAGDLSVAEAAGEGEDLSGPETAGEAGNASGADIAEEVGAGPAAYGDQLYDRALYRAIRKAENYLKPFFAYDLDEIYAVSWDPEDGGGADGDRTTLSADGEAETFCYGLSLNLPYGTYVVAEQQPRDGKPGDAPNRRYRIDRPREIVVPSVYETDSEEDGETLSSRYIYRKDMDPEEMVRRYRIRFCEERDVLAAHSHSGDFQIYKYGAAIRDLRNGPGPARPTDRFALTQDRWKPYLNYYNDSDDRQKEVTYYLSGGLPGHEKIGQVYRYSSVSEAAGEPEGTGLMRGMTEARDGDYSPALVFHSMDPEEGREVPGVKMGPARVRFRNRLYGTRLRIEKMDSETGENLLHDEAIFNIYRAASDEMSPDRARFYERDTVLRGSLEFLESMGAKEIRPAARPSLLWEGDASREGDRRTAAVPAGERYAGCVPAGTPVCREQDQVFQIDAHGIRTGRFASFSTSRDGAMEGGAGESPPADGLQNTGYLQTPQPLEAGTYVLAEVKAPYGYVRCRPVAVEVYGDTVTYYQGGDRDRRVAAAVYPAEEGDRNRSEARIYVENEPTRLRVEKRKEAAGTEEGEAAAPIVYKVSGRIDGSLARIGGNPGYEYAYRDGRYMGYAWKKGTLEYLQSRKEAGEQVEIVYDGELFAGYGYVTGTLQTGGDANPFVTGSVMTLFEGIPVLPSGDSQDRAFEGVEVCRRANGTVSRMYVRAGYAGSRTEMMREQKDGGDFWSGRAVPRGDTDILYYDLGNLQLFMSEEADGRRILYGFGRNRERVPIETLEPDRIHSIFAFRGGRPVLELEGNDLSGITYSPGDRVLEGPIAVPKRLRDGRTVMTRGAALYHLDEEGNRDSLVDPWTGMAYALAGEWQRETGEESSLLSGPGPDLPVRVLVWPVKTARDREGRILARDKIATCRIAEAGGGEEGKEYLTGTWEPEDGEESHELSTRKKDPSGRNRTEGPVLTENSGRFAKEVRPVYGAHGLPEYYRKNEGTYRRETDLYDRSGTWIRRKEADLLASYDSDSYRLGVRAPEEHRSGESYVLENTWVTGESSPDDPFAGEMTDGQPDILKRVPAGAYIMEELEAPAGYRKGLPTGVIVREDTSLQPAGMTDRTIKVEVSKIDGSEQSVYPILLMGGEDGKGGKAPPVAGVLTEGKGTSTYEQVPGAVLALYEAKRIYTSDLQQHPSGTYLQKKGEQPLRYASTDSRTSRPVMRTARWVTGTKPIYLEGIPAGEYLLEEESCPGGFVRAEPAELVVEPAGQVQTCVVRNDHTRVEVEKYTVRREDGQPEPVSGAAFALYPARIGPDGQPEYDRDRAADRFTSADAEEYAGFIEVFEEMYRAYGTEGKVLSWQYGGRTHVAERTSCDAIDGSAAGGNPSRFPTAARLLFRTDEGKDIRITVCGRRDSRQGRDFTFEYQFDYHRMPEVNDRACSYLTADGVRRFDYLPAGGVYLLEETQAPPGFAGAEPVLIEAGDTADVRRYRIFNEEPLLLISKTFEADGKEGTKELAGARLALYRAGAKGELIRDAAHLAAMWISGSDGVYTESDRLGGRIPEGYREGDLRPHALRGLPEGDYWLTETESPDYYTTFEPKFIRCGLEDEIRLIRVSNRPAEGRISAVKTDIHGRKLPGALFRVTAFKPPDFVNPVLERTFGGGEGEEELTGLPVGEIQADGRILPYSYRLRELKSPDGYAVDPEILSFEFAPDRQGESYRWDEYAVFRRRVEDEKTRVVIRKQALPEGTGAPGTAFLEGEFVDGALLAVYRTNGTDGEGSYLYDRQDPVDRWVSSRSDPDHVLEGLTAGQTYLLAEIRAPDGYRRMEPVAFTLSEDGRRIASFSSRLTAVTVHHPGWFTLRGRYGIKCLVEVTDAGGRRVAGWTATGEGRRLTGADGIADGGVYTFTERTLYSDGSRPVTGRVTRAVRLEDGSFPVKDRVPERVFLQLRDRDGRQAAAWYPAEDRPELTVGERDSEKAVLQRNRIYELIETTRYSDGGERTEGLLAFALDEDGSLRTLGAYDAARTARVSKTEADGAGELPGAKLQILDEDGQLVEEWISGDGPHDVEAELTPGSRYTLREASAPEGYETAADIPFFIEEDGGVQQVVMEDVRVPEEPEPEPDRPPGGQPGRPGKEPDRPVKFPEPEPGRYGVARAAYHPRLTAEDGRPARGSYRPRIPGTGDEAPDPGILFGLAALSGAGMLFLWRRGKKAGYFCLLLVLLAAPPLSAKAETVAGTGEREITVTFDAFTGQPEETDIPAESYLWEGREYRLVSWQQIQTERLSRPAASRIEIRYSGVERAAPVPETVPVPGRARTGGDAEGSGPGERGGEEGGVLTAAEIHYENWRWVPDFRFPVTVQGYDAGNFLLGGRLVPVREEQPFAGYERELLEMIGADPEYYRILSSEWSGEPWTGEDGLLWRQAVASGEKYVADARVIYEGKPERSVVRETSYQAVYRLAPDPAEKDPPAEGSLVRVRTRPAAERQEKRPPEAPGGLLGWFWNLSRGTKAVLGLGLLFLPFLCAAAIRLILGRKRSTGA